MKSAVSLLCTALAAAALHAELTDEQKLVPLEADSADASLAKIVLLAGPVSNKPGQHEYFSGCAMLMKCLKQTPGVWPVMAAEGWPKNEAVLKGAKSVVVFMDGGPKCALFEGSRWQTLGGLMKEGAGLVVLHQAVDIPQEQAAEFKSWAGAVWQKDIGSRGHWDMSFTPDAKHDALRGVAPFSAPKDGWLYNLHFAEKNVSPVLTGTVPDTSRSTADAKSHAGRAEVIAWAYERRQRRPELRLHRLRPAQELGGRGAAPPGRERHSLEREGQRARERRAGGDRRGRPDFEHGPQGVRRRETQGENGREVSLQKGLSGLTRRIVGK